MLITDLETRKSLFLFALLIVYKISVLFGASCRASAEAVRAALMNEAVQTNAHEPVETAGPIGASGNHQQWGQPNCLPEPRIRTVSMQTFAGSEPAMRKICGVATANGVDLTRKTRRTKREIANSRQKARSFPISRVVPNKFYFLLIVWGLVALHFFRFDPKRRRSYFPLSCASA